MSSDKQAGEGEDAIVPTDPDSLAFVKGLIARGEAVRPNADGTLPPGATHEIVGTTKDGAPIIRRRRFAKGGHTR